MSVVIKNDSLASIRPDIAKNWHPTLNGALTPIDVAVTSKEVVHWTCDEGHNYEAAINTRTSVKDGCPKCS